MENMFNWHVGFTVREVSPKFFPLGAAAIKLPCATRPKEYRLGFAAPDAHAVQGRREYALLLFMCNAGARAGEAAKLRIGGCRCVVTLRDNYRQGRHSAPLPPMGLDSSATVVLQQGGTDRCETKDDKKWIDLEKRDTLGLSPCCFCRNGRIQSPWIIFKLSKGGFCDPSFSLIRFEGNPSDNLFAKKV
jgi:hypothetical protein